MKNQIKTAYKEFLQTRAGIDLYNDFKAILYSTDDSLIKHIFPEIISQLRNKNELYLLDVGGGDGKRIIQLVCKIHDHFNCKVKLDFVEQSELMCEDFKNRLDVILPFCDVNIHNIEFENYTSDRSYDLTLLIHSIFCLDDFEAIRKLTANMTEDGRLLIVSNDSESLLANLKKELDKGYIDQRYEVSNLTEDLSNDCTVFDEFKFNTIWTVKSENLTRVFSTIIDWLSLGKLDQVDEVEKSKLDHILVEKSANSGNQFVFTEQEVGLLINAKAKVDEATNLKRKAVAS